MREAFSTSVPSPEPTSQEVETARFGFALREAEDARERAEAALEAKSRLLATLSHEIRTPLNGMMGCADLLAATELAPEQHTYVEAIRSSGKSLAALIDEILDLARLDAGKIVLAEASFDLTLLLEGTIEILAPRAHAKGLDIASLIGPNVPTHLVGDAARIRQILLNLLSNAVKFTARGGVGLRVSYTHGKIRFAVADTGPGIAAASIKHIFDEFVQSAPRDAGGTGLGLAISRRLAARMGGKLELEKSSPSGATFVLTLPLSAAADAAAMRPRMKRRVLIVSPSSFEAPYLVEKLSDIGADAARAATLKSGLAAIAQSAASCAPPDTLIVDCALGHAAIAQLVAAAGVAEIKQKLVLFTAAERRALGTDAMAAFNGWLVKPLRLRSLLDRFDIEVQAAKNPAPTAAIDLAGLNILIAEDNEINALVLEKHLGKSGAHIMRVSDGLAALNAVQASAAQSFDAIILDLRMPRLDGFALAREVRRLERERGQRACHLIAVSADAFPEAKAQAETAGIDTFLTKPVDFAALDSDLARFANSGR